MNPVFLALLNTELPSVIALLKEKFAKQNPAAPPMTDAQIHANVITWLAGTLAKDDAIIAGG